MLPLFVTSDTVTPEAGSGELAVPKNHSTFGEGTLVGRGLGPMSAEHSRAKFCPTVLALESEGEMATVPMSTVEMMFHIKTDE